MLPLGLPHARGGVSKKKAARRRLLLSSPRPWGCFWIMENWTDLWSVFPTPVGVFPMRGFFPPSWASLPHALGGVSKDNVVYERGTASSPRPWGCFRVYAPFRATACVFPMPVRVFPVMPPRCTGRLCLPRTPGDVSCAARACCRKAKTRTKCRPGVFTACSGSRSKSRCCRQSGGRWMGLSKPGMTAAM